MTKSVMPWAVRGGEPEVTVDQREQEGLNGRDLEGSFRLELLKLNAQVEATTLPDCDQRRMRWCLIAVVYIAS